MRMTNENMLRRIDSLPPADDRDASITHDTIVALPSVKSQRGSGQTSAPEGQADNSHYFSDEFSAAQYSSAVKYVRRRHHFELKNYAGRLLPELSSICMG